MPKHKKITFQDQICMVATIRRLIKESHVYIALRCRKCGWYPGHDPVCSHITPYLTAFPQISSWERFLIRVRRMRRVSPYEVKVKTRELDVLYTRSPYSFVIKTSNLRITVANHELHVTALSRRGEAILDHTSVAKDSWDLFFQGLKHFLPQLCCELLLVLSLWCVWTRNSILSCCHRLRSHKGR